MSSLGARLREYSRREVSFADVRSECIRIAGADEHTVAQARRQLAKALAAETITQDQFERLEQAMQSVVLADGGSLASIPDPADRTDIGLIRGRPVAPSPGSDDEDATVLRGDLDDDDDDEATVLRPFAGTSDEATATEVVGDDEETVLRPGTTLSEDDTTIVGDDDDPTVLRRGLTAADDRGSEDITVRPLDQLDDDLDDDDRTVILPRSGAAPDPDATVVMAAPGAQIDDNDATRVKPAGDRDAGDDDDPTVVMGGDVTSGVEPDDMTAQNPTEGDKTRVLGAGEFDILDPGMMAAAEQSVTDTSASDNTWDPAAPSRRGPVVDREFTKGSVLKERFRLIDALGEGGMGTVWKAVDTLKLEAEDRNPYVAIKLLQGDFKAHPEAFIALQRESSKQQRLAHPNIATVFDFDREASSNTVFMTMEVMDGSDLSDFIKSLPPEGLPYEEAMGLIEQLGAGLDYAHKAGLVHSDLKPGNCFLTHDGKVKLLDFGIARASATREDAEGEQTKFDPGQLGALTPSYATLEMFQGMEPDPRDDIYAMAIIAYQLFTGKHPYNRRGAPKAMKAGLAPANVDKLTKRQNRALAKGLEFERENRTGSVEEFLDGLRVKKRNKALLALPVVVLLGVAGVAYKPVMDYLDERQVEQIVAEVRPDQRSIATLLDTAAALEDESQRANVYAHPVVKQAVLELFSRPSVDDISRAVALTLRFPAAARDQLLDDPIATNAIAGMFARGDEASISAGLDLAKTLPEIQQRRTLEDSRVIDAVVAILVRGDERSIKAGLALAARFPDNQARRIVEDERASGAIVAIIARADDESIAQGVRLAKLYGTAQQVTILTSPVVGDTLVAKIQRGDAASIESGLALLAQFPGDLGSAIKEDQRTVDAIIGFYRQRMAQVFEPAEQRVDFGAARVLLDKLTSIYPKRGEVRDVADELNAKRDVEIDRLDGRLQAMLKNAEQAPATLLPDASAEDVGDVLQRIRALQPDSEVLDNPAIAEAYRRAANTAIADGVFADAERILAAGLRYAPDATSLARLNSEVLAELKRIEDQRVADEIESRLEPAWAQFNSLADYDAARGDMLRLAEVAPDSALLGKMRSGLRTYVDESFSRHLAAQQAPAAAALLLNYARLFDLDYLRARKQRLATASGAGGGGDVDTAAVAEREQQLGSLLAAPEVTRSWRNAVGISFKELVALAPLDAPAVSAAQARIAQVFAAEAEAAVGRDEYVQAETALAQIERYHPDWAQLPAALTRVREAKATFERKRALQERLARIESLKSEVLSAAVDNQPEAALTAFGKLGEELPSDDVFLTAEGPKAIGQSFGRAAAVAAAQNNFEQALALSNQGLRVAPDMADLQQSRRQYLGQVEARALALQPVIAPGLPVPAVPTVPLAARAEAVLTPRAPGSEAQVQASISPPALGELRAPVESASGAGMVPARRTADGAPVTAGASFARQVADAILAATDTSPEALSAVRVPLEAYTLLYPESSRTLRTALAQRFIGSIVALAKRDGAQARGLASSHAAFSESFADTLPRLNEELATTLSGLILGAARENPLDVSSFREPLATYETLSLPDTARLRTDLGAIIVEGFGAAAASRFESPEFARNVADAVALVPASEALLREQVARGVQQTLVAQLQRQPESLRRLGTRLDVARPFLDSAQMSSLTAQLSAIAASGIAESMAANRADVTPARAAVNDFRGLFGSDAEPALLQAVARPAAAALTGLIDADAAAILQIVPYAKAYAELFPASSVELRAGIAESLTTVLRAALRDRQRTPGGTMAALASARELLGADTTKVAAALAPSFEERLESDVRTSPTAGPDVQAALTAFAALYPSRAKAMRARLAGPVISALQATYRKQVPKLDEVRADLGTFDSVFPEQGETLRSRIRGTVAAEILGTVQARPDGLPEAQQAVADFESVFPAGANALRADVAQVLWSSIEKRAEKGISRLAEVAPALLAFKSAFATEYEQLSGALATRIASAIQRGARDTKTRLSAVAGMLEQFRSLFPKRHDAVAQDVGGAIAERVSARQLQSAADVEAITPALRELGTLFPERQAALRSELGARALARVKALVKPDPRKAHALQQAALKAFPDNGELRAIRIELPLDEIIAARAAFGKARLSAARKQLALAKAKDPAHSTIAPFESELEQREGQARAAYKKYVRVVQTSRRKSDHKKAYQTVRGLWADNSKEFKSLEPPPPYACTPTKAGQGGRHVCFDKIGRRRNDIGPQMVVVPAGGGISEPFAISKYEISVHDYAQYCRSSKQCKAPRLKRTLPMHNISKAQMDAYAAWLSGIAKTTYRLPTAAEWGYAANAAGKQPKRDFNCTVLVGTQQLKGLTLLSVKSGKENGWGLVNYIGNVQELVTDGASLVARGGSFKNKLQNCRIDLAVSHSGQPDAITGFRLVRQLDQ